jgi:excisionase family DNA binding protein
VNFKAHGSPKPGVTSPISSFNCNSANNNRKTPGNSTSVQASSTLVRMVESYGCALTVAQLAKILQVSRGKVYLLVEQGRLPAIRVGSMLRFDPAITSAWIEGRMTIAPAGSVA